MPAFQGDHHAGTVRIEDEQFQTLVGLLVPIAEAAQVFLAEYRASNGLEPPRERPINEQD